MITFFPTAKPFIGRAAATQYNTLACRANAISARLRTPCPGFAQREILHTLSSNYLRHNLARFPICCVCGALDGSAGNRRKGR